MVWGVQQGDLETARSSLLCTGLPKLQASACLKEKKNKGI